MMTVNTISSNSTRQELIAYIQTADDQLITAMNAMAEAYETKNEKDIIDEVVNVDDLPLELRQKYNRALKQSEEGKKISNEDMRLKVEKELNL